MDDQEKTLQPRKGKRGPLPTGKGVPIQVRLQPDLLEALDRERGGDTRPEAIRRLLTKALQ